MANHRLNLIFRFLLEIAALIALAIWGWNFGNHYMKYVFAIGLPMIFAFLWGIFAVPEDPSRSGKAPVPTKGWIRLMLEIGLFAIACWMLYDLGYWQIALAYIIAILFHYIISYDRIMWLLKK